MDNFSGTHKYSKRAWAQLHLGEIDREFRVHWENMVDNESPQQYFARLKDRIEYLLDVRRQHAKDLAESG